VDYLVTEENEIYLIEVNTTPGMSNESIVPQQITASGKSLTSILNEIIAQSI